MPEPGFHFDIGEYKCIIFLDGTLVGQDLKSDKGDDLNSIFIDSGDFKILIDTGCGDAFQSTAGRLVENLEAEGIRCSNIDKIIFSHGHIDHVGGSCDSKGDAVFPNSRYITSEREWEYWVTPPGSNELQNMFFSIARKYLLPVRDRFDLIMDDVEVLPGIKFVPAPGHTPGNIMVEISSEGKRLLCIGDIVHTQLEFTDLKYSSLFDVEPEQALSTRARILSEIAGSGILVFACHFPFPGLGHITHKEGNFAWQPI